MWEPADLWSIHDISLNTETSIFGCSDPDPLGKRVYASGFVNNVDGVFYSLARANGLDDLIFNASHYGTIRIAMHRHKIIPVCI